MSTKGGFSANQTVTMMAVVNEHFEEECALLCLLHNGSEDNLAEEGREEVMERSVKPELRQIGLAMVVLSGGEPNIQAQLSLSCYSTSRLQRSDWEK